MKVALVGCGAIGTVIARAIAEDRVEAELLCVFDLDRRKADEICSLFLKKPKVALSFEELLSGDAQLVIEAASIGAAKAVLIPALRAGKDVLLLSVGALADDAFLSRVEKTARGTGRRVYLPSGAIGALDALKSAREAGLEEVKITTTKPPQALEGAPYLAEKGISLKGLKERRRVFSGYAREAIKGFPANINVAVAVSLAGAGVDKTRVEIVADPKVERNVHEVHAKGDFGELYFRVENLPSPENPRTSMLAALSAIATLRRIAAPVQVGT
ncbi:aspartate dehydrogenase [Candidatus Pyrohabitans sp.]